MTRDKKIDCFVDEVFRAWLYNLGSTAADLAEQLGVSAATVRRWYSLSRRRVTSRQIEQPTYSRNYRHMQHGTTQVTVYEPTRAELRERFLQVKDSVPAPKGGEA